VHRGRVEAAGGLPPDGVLQIPFKLLLHEVVPVLLHDLLGLDAHRLRPIRQGHPSRDRVPETCADRASCARFFVCPVCPKPPTAKQQRRVAGPSDFGGFCLVFQAKLLTTTSDICYITVFTSLVEWSRMSFRYGRRTSGFSLVELLVVIGIIVLLIAILLPVVNRIRAISRSTKCLANLQQWGHSYEMYLNANNNKPISEVDGAGHLRWWEVLSPYNDNVRTSLLCPDAYEPRAGAPVPDGDKAWISWGSAFAAWRAASKWSSGRVFGNDYFGSYCINAWTFHHRPRNMQQLYIRFPARQAARIPLLGDSMAVWAVPTTGDPVPTNLIDPERDARGGIGGYCIDRHQMAVNVVFLDGHGEHVPLAGLWQLKWTENSVPRDVVVPTP